MLVEKTYYNADKTAKLEVGYMEDGFVANPREEYNIAEFTTREHRNYNLPKEFGFDWDAYDEWDMKEIEKMDKKYHIFFLDCYEHGWMKWSLAWKGMQCMFDTANRVWLMRVNKNEVENRDKALEIVEEELDRYNKWLNGEIYGYQFERLVKWTSEDWREKTEWEYVDGCNGFYEIEEAIEDAKSLGICEDIVYEN